jgi:transcriptional regulator of arginine metabolism
MKRQRQQAILELVRREPLGSQVEIQTRLAVFGHPATQSTISRDLDELGLVRVRDGRGHLRYAEPTEATAQASASRLRMLLQEFLVSIEPSGTLALAVTPPGAANAVAEAIDHAGIEGVLGTVAGDNTILIVAKEGTKGSTVARRVKQAGGMA